MGLSVTMIFYLLIGVGVATAVFLADSRRSRGSAGFRVATALVFWPLYLPILLSGSGARTDTRKLTRAERWRRHGAGHRPG